MIKRIVVNLEKLNADRLDCNVLHFRPAVLALERQALAGTELEYAQPATLRTRLLKISVCIIVTVRKVWLSMSQAFPLQRVFAAVHARLTAAPAMSP